MIFRKNLKRKESWFFLEFGTRLLRKVYALQLQGYKERAWLSLKNAEIQPQAKRRLHSLDLRHQPEVDIKTQ